MYSKRTSQHMCTLDSIQLNHSGTKYLAKYTRRFNISNAFSFEYALRFLFGCLFSIVCTLIRVSSFCFATIHYFSGKFCFATIYWPVLNGKIISFFIELVTKIMRSQLIPFFLALFTCTKQNELEFWNESVECGWCIWTTNQADYQHKYKSNAFITKKTWSNT